MTARRRGTATTRQPKGRRKRGASRAWALEGPGSPFIRGTEAQIELVAIQTMTRNARAKLDTSSMSRYELVISFDADGLALPPAGRFKRLATDNRRKAVALCSPSLSHRLRAPYQPRTKPEKTRGRLRTGNGQVAPGRRGGESSSVARIGRTGGFVADIRNAGIRLKRATGI